MDESHSSWNPSTYECHLHFNTKCIITEAKELHDYALSSLWRAHSAAATAYWSVKALGALSNSGKLENQRTKTQRNIMCHLSRVVVRV